jgi:sugar/nucleoside kinase (ribokinase family)
LSVTQKELTKIMASKKKIIGIGNALMDVVVKLTSNEVLTQNNLPKGSMTLVDLETSGKINEATKNYERIYAPGGSAANTIHGLANLGVESAFLGKVGNDQLGNKYKSELEKIGALPRLFQSNTPTGVAMAMVTPDSERTFATYLGAAIELVADEITIDLFRDYDIAYVEGYLVQNHALVRKVLEMTRKAGLIIALDLASYNVVEDNIDFLNEIIEPYVDVIFANEDEAKAFTGFEPEAAARQLAKICDIAVVKTGKNGSIIQHNVSSRLIDIFGNICVDTTGAGDLYAAGFLYGFSNNYSLTVCGQIASIVAGHVVSIYGARMDTKMWNIIKSEIAEVIE